MFPTEQQAYHRLRWDPRFDVRRCHVVISLRPTGTQRLPFLELDTNAVPWHRIVELWVDDELAWSRPQRIDRLDELAARADARAAAAPATAAPSAPAIRLPAVALESTPAAPHRFDARADRWVPHTREGARAAGAQPTALRVAAWNLLHDRHEAASLRSEERWRDALGRLAALDADVIVLAEVTPPIWDLVLAQPWIRERYAAVPGPGAPSLQPFGQALLSRLPIREAAVGALPRRSVLLATLAAGERSLGVAALHLTSNRVDGAAELRRTQLAAIASHVRATPRDGWLLAGDFNADPEDHAAETAALGAVDPWEALRPDEPGYTFDIDKNPLAAQMSVRGRSARYDRILAIGPALAPRAVELFGIEPGPCGLPPSDHFGIRADLALAAIGDAVTSTAPPASASSASAARSPSPAARTAASSTRPSAAPSDLAHAPPSRRTALALVPPPEAWGAIQRIRCREDRGFPRWPPHVTLFHPFVDEAWLEPAAHTLGELAAATAPFELVLDRIDAIDARGATIVLFPDRRSNRAVQQLREAIARPFATLLADARDFRPHLTIARLEAGRARPELPPQRWRVEHLTILRESEAGRLEPVHTIALGPRHRGTTAPAAAPAAPPAPPIDRAIAELRAAAGDDAPTLEIAPFGSAVYAPPFAADLDLIVRGTADLADHLAAALPLRPLGTEPPRLRGLLAGVPADLMFIPPGEPADDRMRGLLAGPRDGALLTEHLRDHGRTAAFLAAWPHVRRFAAARALAANGLGWFGHFGWALLLAVPLVHDEALCALPPGRVLPTWLRWLGALRPGARIGLDAIRTGDPEPLYLAPPAPPSRNAARGLTSGTSALWFDEIRRAVRALGDAATDEAAAARIAIDLAGDPPPGAALAVTGAGAGLRGRYEGRFRGLLLSLEREVGAVRPWGRFDATGGAPEAWEHRITVSSHREPEARALVEEWLAAELGGEARVTRRTS